MKIFTFLFLLISAFLLGSCHKDDKGSLTLRFIARVDADPLVMFEPHSFIDEYDLQFTHLSMLISDLQLSDNGDPEFLSDIELVDMSFEDVAAASQGFEVHFDDIPAATYDEISFGIGVPPDVNSKTPADFPSSSPLSKTGYYWIPWSSYIFMKTEGRIDTALPGDFETAFAYHTGSDHLYRILESGSGFPITIEDGKDTEISIVIDYALLLEGIDIASKPQNHNPEDSIQIGKIVNNLQNAITLFQ
jgi:hypothetical protein